MYKIVRIIHVDFYKEVNVQYIHTIYYTAAKSNRMELQIGNPDIE